MKKTENQRILVLVILFAVLTLYLSGCRGAVTNQAAPGVKDYQSYEGSGSANQTQSGARPAQQEPVVPDGLPLSIQPAPNVELDLQPFDGGFFSMNLPSGWVLEPVGEYENFGFRAYDPNNPARQIFFYGNMKYFLKSNAGKDAWATYLAYGGNGDAQVFADALVLAPATTEQFFYTFNDYTAYAAKYGVVHNFPIFDDLEIMESTPRNSPIAANCVDDSIVRTLFTQDDVLCEGLFAAGVADAMASYMYNVDAGYYVVYFITGISAPCDEFYLLQDALSESLSSFQYTESYIQQGVQRIDEGTQLALEIGKCYRRRQIPIIRLGITGSAPSIPCHRKEAMQDLAMIVSMIPRREKYTVQSLAFMTNTTSTVTNTSIPICSLYRTTATIFIIGQSVATSINSAEYASTNNNQCKIHISAYPPACNRQSAPDGW